MPPSEFLIPKGWGEIRELAFLKFPSDAVGLGIGFSQPLFYTHCDFFPPFRE